MIFPIATPYSSKEFHVVVNRLVCIMKSPQTVFDRMSVFQ